MEDDSELDASRAEVIAMMNDMSLKSTRSSRQFALGDSGRLFSSNERKTMVWTSTIPSKIGGAVMWPLNPLRKAMKIGKKKRRKSKLNLEEEEAEKPPPFPPLPDTSALSNSADRRGSLMSKKMLIPEESMMLTNIFDNTTSEDVVSAI